MSSYNYVALLTEDTDIQKAVTALVIGVGLVVLGKSIHRRLVSPDGTVNQTALIPAERGGWFGITDYILESFVNFFDSMLGKENRKHVPFVATVFFFILTANLIGLVPGVPAVTTTVWINVALALTVFLHFNGLGVKTHGFWGYLKHFAGPVVFLAPLMFPLEIFSTLLRVLTLNLRLYWNITADHIVLEIFTSFLGPLTPIVFLVLGTFVCFMQAFIFTTLTCVYILLATQHDEDAHHESAHAH